MQREAVMNRDVLAKISGAAGLIVTLLIVAAIPVKTTSAASVGYGEVISVSCYKGNPGEWSFIGNITAPTPEIASQSCNSLYAECQGECSGCFPDSDITENVCYDKAGRKFLN